MDNLTRGKLRGLKLGKDYQTRVSDYGNQENYEFTRGQRVFCKCWPFAGTIISRIKYISTSLSRDSKFGSISSFKLSFKDRACKSNFFNFEVMKYNSYGHVHK